MESRADRITTLLKQKAEIVHHRFTQPPVAIHSERLRHSARLYVERYGQTRKDYRT